MVGAKHDLPGHQADSPEGHESWRQGITLTKKVMKNIERRLERTVGLEAWFIESVPIQQTG
jgi:hypothetical protein